MYPHTRMLQMRYLIIAIGFISGCRTSQCLDKPAPVRWYTESGISTQLDPNSPKDGNPYWMGKVDVSFKVKREW